MRKVIIFGNGLGMSLDPSSYALSIALSAVWESGVMSVDQKALIAGCLPMNVKQPNAEEHMGMLQEMVAACEIILERGPKGGAAQWLTEEGRRFPEALNRYVFETAVHMHNARYKLGDKAGMPCRLPGSFMAPLAEFTKKTSSHIATLNYDCLLSSALIDAGLLEGASPQLRDGFSDGFFDRTNLIRETSSNQGWYLHLHGCPLFVDDGDGRVRKISHASLKAGRRKHLKRVGKHIVLTHAQHKQSLISASSLLRIYWEFFQLALAECEEVLVFGYSGNDTHLNRMIAQVRAKKTVRVIEWLGAGEKSERESFWSAQFGGNVTLEQEEHPLHFQGW